MKAWLWIGAVMMLMPTAGSSFVGSENEEQEKPAASGAPPKPGPTSNQLLMREKLAYANQALDGLALGDFDKMIKSAQMMRMISRASSWHVLDSDAYTRFSKNFQEQAADLERHAKEKNLEAAAMDYMRISLTCVHCHQYVREMREKSKP